MNPLETLSEGQRAEMFGNIDHQIKMREAKPGQRQRALVLGMCEINEDEKNYRYSNIEDLVPVAYADRYYPNGATYLLWQATQSLGRFIVSLEKGRRQAVEIADEIRDEIGCEDLSDGEIIDVVTRTMDFKDYAIRIGLKHEDDFKPYY
jgi:hypothetical protein